ncbi:MAG: hypothetical protein AAF449_23670, partial [Myxococcota bacterium]
MTTVVRAGAALICLLAIGCGRDSAGLFFSTPPPELQISPGQLDLIVGQTFRFDVLEVDGAATTSVLNAPGLTVEALTPQVVSVFADGQG